MRRALLEIDDVKEKLRRLTTILGRELEVLELGKKIQKEAQGSMEKVQREYFLARAAQGHPPRTGRRRRADGRDRGLSQQIESAGMPEEAEKEALRELSRMEKMPIAAAEYSVIKTYLDWMVNLPWSTATEDNLDIAHARAGAGRRPLWPGGHQGAHPRIPGRAQAAPGAQGRSSEDKELDRCRT